MPTIEHKYKIGDNHCYAHEIQTIKRKEDGTWGTFDAWEVRKQEIVARRSYESKNNQYVEYIVGDIDSDDWVMESCIRTEQEALDDLERRK